MMNLTPIIPGYTPDLEDYRQEYHPSFEAGRVIAEHRERYLVKTAEGDYEGEITGTLRFTATSRADFPAVGDWVAVSPYDDDKVLIHAVFPRKTLLERQAVGRQGEKQIMAANVDYAFILQAVDRDFSINRMERYLSLCHAGGIEAGIILNKIDLIDREALSAIEHMVKGRLPMVSVLSISNQTNTGIREISDMIISGHTYCFLGSSGVGKSTLLNNLLGKEAMRTDHISESTQRGRHVTTHRELHILANGGIIIDNPGMREVGMTDNAGGLEVTGEQIRELSRNCRYRDCTHTTESGCAVLAAVENGNLEPAAWENYQRLEREKEYMESTIAEKRRKDKDLGKMINSFKKNNYKNR